MFPRSQPLPDETFFLFGARGTGKTTWLKERVTNGLWFDLLDSRRHIELLRDPGLLTSEVRASKSSGWVVIDEVQRIPALLDEVQRLLTEAPARRFALTGSSARKLKRHEVNLLAGRAVTRRFFPLTAKELGAAFVLDDALQYGTLPRLHVGKPSRSTRIDRLESYADTYLREEIQFETRLRDLGSFTRFLAIAAIANAQVVNVSNIARDAAVARQTVQGYFDVLIDTLVGVWLPAWSERVRIKQVLHPKFYFFDTGAVRALAGRLREPLEAEERGRLFETWLFHELRAYREVSRCGGEFSYWRTPSGSEIDFIWTRGKSRIGIEAKATQRWRSGDGEALKGLCRDGTLTAGHAVYAGDVAIADERVDVLPWQTFLDRLYAGEVLPA